MPMTEGTACVCRYGNTSSGSLWYALSYIETCQRVKKGETVWQVSHSNLQTCSPISLWVPTSALPMPDAPAAYTQQERGRVALACAVGQLLGSCMTHGSWACS